MYQGTKNGLWISRFLQSDRIRGSVCLLFMGVYEKAGDFLKFISPYNKSQLNKNSNNNKRIVRTNFIILSLFSFLIYIALISIFFSKTEFLSFAIPHFLRLQAFILHLFPSWNLFMFSLINFFISIYQQLRFT